MPSDTILTLQTDVISTIISSDINTSSTIVSATQGPSGAGDLVHSFITDNTLNKQVIDTFSYTQYGSAKYVVYATNGTTRQVCELLVIHDNITVSLVEYANIYTSTPLVVFDVSINSSSVQLMATPSIINTVFKITRTLLPS